MHSEMCINNPRALHETKLRHFIKYIHRIGPALRHKEAA